MNEAQKKKLADFLQRFILPERMEKFKTILQDRTRHLTVVLEDIFQPQNASAVLRTCECFGIQDVHIIENENSFEINPDVVMGASKWLSLHQYNDLEFNTESCLKTLKEKGYRLIATSPLPGGIALEQMPVDQKTALIFGNELKGLSPKALELAHAHMHIPMRGFTESLNISVSAAICIHHLSNQIRKQDVNWQLTPQERIELLLSWMNKTLKNPQALVNYFNKNESVV